MKTINIKVTKRFIRESLTNKTKASRRIVASDNGSYPLPNIQADHYPYEDIISKGNKNNLRINKSKESISKAGKINR